MCRPILKTFLFLSLWACVEAPSFWWESLNDGEVSYNMSWSGRSQFGTTFRTPLGYEVTITQAELNHWLVQLSPCAEGETEEELGWYRWLSTVAWAGHSFGDEELEISQVVGPLLEDLLRESSWEVPVREVGGGLYCSAYWSVGALHFDDGRVTPSLRLRGLWSHPESNEGGEIWVDSTINWGALVALGQSDTSPGVQLRNEKTRVTWMRQGHGLFDEVDFRFHDSDAIARRVLEGLVGEVEVVLEHAND